MSNTFTQEIRCFNCAYTLSRCICPGKSPEPVQTVASISAAARRGEQISLYELAQAQRREQQPKTFTRTRANAEALSLTEQAEESILDDILDATQKHMAGFTAAMPPSVQAKRETQKLLPIQRYQSHARKGLDEVARAPMPPDPVKPQAPPKKRSLSDLASLL